MTSLIEELQAELNRNRRLLSDYASISTGGFGAAVIRADIELGEKSINEGDVLLMLVAYNKLQQNE